MTVVFSMKSLLFDRSLGYKLANHFESKFNVKCFNRKDVAKWLNRNPAWNISDSKFIKFALEKDCILVTGDYSMYKQALRTGISTIFIWNKLPFWTRILRLLLKLDHPYFLLANYIDLRLLWGSSCKWKMPSNPVYCKNRSLTDKTYIWK